MSVSELWIGIFILLIISLEIVSKLSIFGLIPSLITSVTSANLLGAIVDKVAAISAKITEIINRGRHLSRLLNKRSIDPLKSLDFSVDILPLGMVQLLLT